MTLKIDQLEQSFSQVSDRDTEFAATFYSTLFADYPEVQGLFDHTSITAQGKKLFASLVLVVENLQNPEVLSHSLKGLGTRHVQYGVLPQHYPMVGGALLKTFGQLLGPGWTADLQQAWTEAYQAVAALMLEGADYPPGAIDLPAVEEPAAKS
jgi:hemoglobin-like flavoprotein